jgi:hypothetical protein
VSTVQLVDLATGACAQQPDLLHPRRYLAAGRLLDGRIVCAGGIGGYQSLVVDCGAHWEALPSMHDTRFHSACGAVAGCVIVAGGNGRTSADLYDEELNRWLRLPCDLPNDDGTICRSWHDMGSALL